MKNLTKIQKIGKVLLILVSVMMIFGSFGMIFANPNSKEALMFAPLHLGNYIHILGVIKLLVGVLLFFPHTRYMAALVGTGYLGGAIMATIVGGMVPFIAGLVLIVLWIGMELLTHNFLHICHCGKCMLCKDNTCGDCKNATCSVHTETK